VVNFARCDIGDSGGASIGVMLQNRYVRLTCLDLHWNRMQAKAGIAIAKGLKLNDSL
jgi:tmRNA-binding protein